jgi:hypothetical protein
LDKSEEEEDINAKLKRKKVEAIKKYNHIAQKKNRKEKKKTEGSSTKNFYRKKKKRS